MWYTGELLQFVNKSGDRRFSYVNEVIKWNSSRYHDKVNYRKSWKFPDAHFVLKSTCIDAGRTRMKFEIGNRGISFRRTNSFRQSIVTIVHALGIYGKLLCPNIVHYSDNCLSKSEVPLQRIQCSEDEIHSEAQHWISVQKTDCQLTDLKRKDIKNIFARV